MENENQILNKLTEIKDTTSNLIGNTSCERPTFKKAIENVINSYSMERAGGNTPDFLLAEFLNSCLSAYGKTVNERDRLNGLCDKK